MEKERKMVINTGIELLGSKKPPLKPTNRRMIPAGSSGVVVMNLAGESLKRHDELMELRNRMARLKSDLGSAMGALSMANQEIERLKKNSSSKVNAALSEQIQSCEEEFKMAMEEVRRLYDENKALKAEVESLKKLNGELSERLESSISTRGKKKKQKSDGSGSPEGV